MIDSINTPFPECKRILFKEIKLDPHFAEFYDWARSNNVPVVVLSSGMIPIIRALLEHLLGPEANEIQVVANEMVDRAPKTRDQPGGWNIKFHDESGFGHDKSRTIRPYQEYFENHPNEKRPAILYAGDGVSDLSAAKETDLLFAKKGQGWSFSEMSKCRIDVCTDLVAYCEREGVPFTVFEDWSSILAKTKQI